MLFQFARPYKGDFVVTSAYCDSHFHENTDVSEDLARGCTAYDAAEVTSTLELMQLWTRNLNGKADSKGSANLNLSQRISRLGRSCSGVPPENLHERATALSRI